MRRGEARGGGADKSTGHLARQRLYLHLVALTLGLAAIGAGAVYLLHGSQARAQSGTPPAAGAQRDFAPLKGRWMRPDGGYVIEIKAIDANGKMVAAYFNPRPINVSRAEASREGAALRVFVELRDVNYPGATYTLTYDPGGDQLKGVYFQPALQQSFDVVFVRLK